MKMLKRLAKFYYLSYNDTIKVLSLYVKIRMCFEYRKEDRNIIESVGITVIQRGERFVENF